MHCINPQSCSCLHLRDGFCLAHMHPILARMQRQHVRMQSFRPTTSCRCGIDWNAGFAGNRAVTHLPHAQVRMQAASTAAQAQAVAASTGASVPDAPKAAAEVRRYPNARAAYGIIARHAPALRVFRSRVVMSMSGRLQAVHISQAPPPGCRC